MKDTMELTGQDIQTAAKCIEKVGTEINAMLRYIEEDLTDLL